MGLITLELNEDEARLIRHALGKAIEEGSLAETDLEVTAAAHQRGASATREVGPATMSAYGDKLLQSIIEAYADAGRKQPAEYPALPAWQDLPIRMREAFIHVFAAGR